MAVPGRFQPIYDTPDGTIDSDTPLFFPRLAHTLELVMDQKLSRISSLPALPHALRCLRLSTGLLAIEDLEKLPHTLDEMDIKLELPLAGAALPAGLTKLSVSFTQGSSQDFSNFVVDLPKHLTYLHVDTQFYIQPAHLKPLPSTITELSLKNRERTHGTAPLEYHSLPPHLVQLSVDTTAPLHLKALISALPGTLLRLYLLSTRVHECDLALFPMLADFNCDCVIIDGWNLQKMISSSKCENEGAGQWKTLHSGLFIQSISKPLRRLTSRHPCFQAVRFVSSRENMIQLEFEAGFLNTLENTRFEHVCLPADPSLLEKQGHLIHTLELGPGLHPQCYTTVATNAPHLKALNSSAWPSDTPLPATLTTLRLQNVPSPMLVNGLKHLTSLECDSLAFRHLAALPKTLLRLHAQKFDSFINLAAGTAPRIPPKLTYLSLPTAKFDLHEISCLPESLTHLRIGRISLHDWEFTEKYDTCDSQPLSQCETPVEATAGLSGELLKVLASGDLRHAGFEQLITEHLSRWFGFQIDVVNPAVLTRSMQDSTLLPSAYYDLTMFGFHALSTYMNNLTRLEIIGHEAESFSPAYFQYLPRALRHLVLVPASMSESPQARSQLIRGSPSAPKAEVRHIMDLPQQLITLEYLSNHLAPCHIVALPSSIRSLGILLDTNESKDAIMWPTQLEYLHIVVTRFLPSARQHLPPDLKTLVTSEVDPEQSDTNRRATGLPTNIEVFQLLQLGDKRREVNQPALIPDAYPHLRFAHIRSPTQYTYPLLRPLVE